MCAGQEIVCFLILRMRYFDFEKERSFERRFFQDRDHFFEIDEAFSREYVIHKLADAVGDVYCQKAVTEVFQE